MVLEYTGTEIEYKPLDSYKGDVILFNKLNGVRTDNVNYLAAHFRSVKKYAGPYIKYGFFFPPARFLKDGNYYSEINAPFLTTCVGFCLMVLNGLLSPEVFIETEAWKTASEASRTYLKTFQKLSRRVSVADAVNFKPHIKRVLPIEYFAASFLKQRKREHILAWKKVLQKVLH